jgi:ribosome maturation factor RimP
MSIILNKIEKKVKEIIKREQVELVEYRAFNIRGKLTIRCLVDYPEGGITLDSLGRLNKTIFNQLQEDLSDIDYKVEVNSPGLDRTLKQPEDFLKVKGKDILLWLKEPVLDKQFMEARLEGLEENKLILSYKGDNIFVDFGKVKSGKQKFRT